MRSIALCLACLCAVACGGDDDGGGSSGDASATADARTVDGDGAPIERDAGDEASCQRYCDLIAEGCVERIRQYANVEECLTTCALFPPGEPGDEVGNSLSCRLYHAELALEEPEPHCYHAGPSGGQAAACGSACENYCAIMVPTCPEEFADQGECMEICAGFPDPGPYTIFESRSDTVACRIFHATRATAAPSAHCGTASPDSSTCVE